MDKTFFNGKIILPDRIVTNGAVVVEQGRIREVLEKSADFERADSEFIDLKGNYLSPGFVDIHVHGGAGHDFMDATPEAFQSVCNAHLRHGTTSLTPTTSVAPSDLILDVLRLCKQMRHSSICPTRVLGCHFYGPYFLPEARGCHPFVGLAIPEQEQFEKYLHFASCINRATVAPELPGAREFVLACREKSIPCNIGHSHATFDEVAGAISWGVTHVDHLYCAMSDRSKLRQSQPFPMRGGVLEATLFFDELTTEVIADGKHLQPELLLLAYRIKGADRLAIVTDCSRALEMPDGQYFFGPKESGEPFIKRDGVGVTLDGTSLASSVVGMDQCLQFLHSINKIPLFDLVRMASLTPARIAGHDQELGSIEEGKLADFVVLNSQLGVEAVYVGGDLVFPK